MEPTLLTPEELAAYKFVPSESSLSLLPPIEMRNRYGERNRVICWADQASLPQSSTPDSRLIADATDGIILWKQGCTLNYGFNASSFQLSSSPELTIAAVRTLFAHALAGWGDSAPVRFIEANNAYDFEFVLKPRASADELSSALAKSFFPSNRQEKFEIYPLLFEQSVAEQIETLQHELGHVFGLRHFFAREAEAGLAVLFGTDTPFSIMNYGVESTLSQADLSDLIKLYSMAWDGRLRSINQIPIGFVLPYHLNSQQD